MGSRVQAGATRHDSVPLGDGAETIGLSGEARRSPQHGSDRRPEGSKVGFVGSMCVKEALQVLDMPKGPYASEIQV
jgi:hypothetical protein